MPAKIEDVGYGTWVEFCGHIWQTVYVPMPKGMIAIRSIGVDGKRWVYKSLCHGDMVHSVASHQTPDTSNMPS